MDTLVEVGRESEPPIPSRRDLEVAGVHIVCAVPMERTVPSDTFASFWSVARNGYPLFARPYDRTDTARNTFAEALLASDFTHVCMLDLDQLHPEDTVERLARWVLDDPQRQVVASLSFRRGTPFDPLAFIYDDQGKPHALAEWDAPLIRAHVVGHGSILIHRDVFLAMPAPWWVYTYQAGSSHTSSEDMYFCRQCFQHGIPIWVDTTTTAPHLITSLVDESSFRQYLAEHPELVHSVETAAD